MPHSTLIFTPAARVLAEVNWTEGLHPRGRGGLWIDSLGGHVEPTTLGVTPYLQKLSNARGQAVPKTHAEAAALHKDPAWQPLFHEFEVTAEALAAKHGVTLHQGERNVGVFEGTFEPSYALAVSGDKKKIDAYAKDLGNHFEQKAVVGFTAGKGNDIELRMPKGKDPDAFYREVVKIMGADNAGVTYDGSQWRIFVGSFLDNPKDIVTKLTEAAKRHGMSPQAFVGTGDYHQLREGTG